MTAESESGGADGKLIVIVVAPRSTEKKKFEWSVSKKVGDAAREAALAFHYDGGHPGFQTETKPPRQLDNDMTLGAEHVVTGQVLELVDVGGGV